jgi:uncharacterized phage protein (TIGR01671 family)
MREIKFRAWNSMDKEMMYGVWLSPDGSVIDFEYGNVVGTYPKDQVIPLQYTGLKDKNGTEIYEGDIVKYKSFFSSDYVLGVVEYTEQAEWAVDMRLLSRIYSNVEVIGNIYEHPHLLGSEEK